MQPDELKAKFVEYLDRLDSGVQTAGEFVANEAPLVVSEYLQWQVISNGFVAVLCLLVIATAVWSCFRIFKSDWMHELAAIPAVIIFPIALVFCISSIQCGKAYFAPRVVILEKIHDLVK